MFRHVGIVVDDIDIMSKFYQETFGLELMYDEVEEGGFLQHIVGFDKARAHIHKLGKDGQTIVELLNWDLYHEMPVYNKMFSKGISHFAMTVDDIEETLKKSHKIINPPKISPDGNVKVAFCHDPEDNIIELVECI